jgi:hypothetical protein
MHAGPEHRAVYRKTMVLFAATGILLVAGVFAAWMAIRQRDRRVEDVRSVVESLGGYVSVSNRRGQLDVELGGTNVDDESLRMLEPKLLVLPDLVEVNLYGTKITDEGLKYLSELTSLQVLQLRGTRVTERGVQNLQKQLPYCQISYGRLYSEECVDPASSENRVELESELEQ